MESTPFDPGESKAPADDDLSQDEITGGAPSIEDDPDIEVIRSPEELMKAMTRDMEEARRAREAELTELFGEERFDDGGECYLKDLDAYDQAAYTRSKYDYSSYRYNLSDSSYAYSGGWMSSWYSGYSSVDRAIEGVHNHVATFVTNPGYGILEIVPDLDVPESESIECELRISASDDGHGYVNPQKTRALIARIDSSLYDKLGISEAQQHYIVDGISQVLAAQSLPDPTLVTYLQSAGGPLLDTLTIPNVTREIITELMRAMGLPILLDEMPGWLKRVTAFRSVMFVGEPPEGEIPSAYLMYAVWERDVIDTIEHQDAVSVINEIEEILRKDKWYTDPKSPLFTGIEPYSGSHLNKTHSARIKCINEIERLLINYVTNFGSTGVIVQNLCSIRDKVEHAIGDSRVLTKEESDEVNRVCGETMELIHENNRTFCPDPSKDLEINHLEYPSCPSRELLPESKRNRVELSRKCAFHFKRIPYEVINLGSDEGGEDPLIYIKKALKRIDDMLGLAGQSEESKKKRLIEAEQESLKRLGGNSDMHGGRSGVNRTRHPELRSRAPVCNISVDRSFGLEDPEFDREVIIFDATLSN